MKRLIAVGDIHGCITNLRSMVEDKIKLQADDKVILLGDYIDRGKYSREVVEYILSLIERGFDVIPLIGNHEVMLLDSADSRDLSTWLWNGGDETLRSFGISNPEDLEEKYVVFFRNLKWYYRHGNYLFVHAGFNDEAVNPFDDKISMVWIRRENYNNRIFKDFTIVHGHTPVTMDECISNVQMKSRVINLDTGAVYSGPGYGKLTAMDLISRELYHS